MSKHLTRLLLVVLLMGLYPFRVLSQDCQTRYLSLTYKGTTWDTFSHAAYAPNNEIIAAGSLVDYNGSAHLARYSKNGIPIWSNYYNIGYFTFYNPTFFSKVKFNDFVLTPDGGIVVAGTVLRYYNNRVQEIYSQVALLSKLDKYGNVVWTRSYMPANGYADLSFSNIYQTTDGDFIVYMAHDKGPSLYPGAASHNRVIRFSSTGQIKWATNLYTGHYDAGGTGVSFRRGITQLADRNIVIADAVYQTARGTDNLRMSDGRLHFFSLDYSTGGIKWESSYPYTLPATDTFFVPDINHIAELPGGKLSFTTSLYLSTPALPALTKRPVSIITDNKGVTQQLVTYYLPSGNECLLKDVTAASLPGTKSMLLKDGSLSVVATINPDGSVSAAKGYNSSYPPNCFAVGPRGNSIFMSDNRSLSYKLMMTDSNGGSACADAATALLSESLAPANDNPAIVITIPTVYTPVSSRDYFIDHEYPLKIKSEYPLVTTTDCEQLLDCCRDIIDTVNISNVTICEGASYRLPDNTEIKSSGTYYFTYQTVTGCDSITYIKLKLDKNPNSLSLGADSCLTGNN
ncbi:MAG: hypothetical protein JNM19_03090, partial [Chitinophagaceae bacterium]|nr:hypothetical protein [Chitinophagaceae bacterium]